MDRPDRDLLTRIEERTAIVGVIGLGYVGLPLAVELARHGLRTIGIDLNERVVQGLNEGRSHVRDVPSEQIAAAVGDGRLSATTDLTQLATCDAIAICVPTPLGKLKDPDLSHVIAAAQAVRGALRPGQLVVLESTTYPGTTREVVLPILAQSGLTVGTDFFLCFSPERVDPGNPVWHIGNTPRLLGGITEACTRAGLALYQTVIETMMPVGSVEVAELAKVYENTFRMVNIALANELAQACERLGLDAWEVIDAAATKPFGFMKFTPGPGLGGHCIPLDPLYLSWKMATLEFKTRLIELASEVNAEMPAFVVRKVSRRPERRGAAGARQPGAGARRGLQAGRRRPAGESGPRHHPPAAGEGRRRALPRSLLPGDRGGRAHAHRGIADARGGPLGRPPGRGRRRGGGDGPLGGRLPARRRPGPAGGRRPRRHAPPARPGPGGGHFGSDPSGDPGAARRHRGPMMRVLVVAGARPNFMKVAPVLAALRAAGDEGILVHTGQHYDVRMSDAFFRDLGLPEPDYHLGVGSGSHAQQTARVMERFEPVLLEARPDWVVVVGDVNSTLACALVAVKLQAETGVAIAHVEAGLRSRDWRMPEEINRVLTDRISDLLLTPSRDAAPNLRAEGIPAERIEFVGNVMIDTLFAQREAARALDMPGRLGLERGGYAVVTLHRPSNVDDPAALNAVLAALAAIAEEVPVVFPIHPRTEKNAAAFGARPFLEALRVMPPLGYAEMLSLTDGAAVVLTDSGGLQEETTALGVPCVTLREQTERPITVTEGTNRLAPWPLTTAGVVEAFRAARAAGRRAPGQGYERPEGWDGRAGERIVAAMRAHQSDRRGGRAGRVAGLNPRQARPWSRR